MKNFTPDQVRAMSMAEVTLSVDGFTALKQAEAGVSDRAPPTQEEIDEMKALHPDVPPPPGAELLPEWQSGWDGTL